VIYEVTISAQQVSFMAAGYFPLFNVVKHQEMQFQAPNFGELQLRFDSQAWSRCAASSPEADFFCPIPYN